MKELGSSMCALGFYYHGGIIIATWSPECSRTDFSMKDAIGEGGGRKVGKEGFRPTFLMCATNETLYTRFGQKVDTNGLEVSTYFDFLISDSFDQNIDLI